MDKGDSRLRKLEGGWGGVGGGGSFEIGRPRSRVGKALDVDG